MARSRATRTPAPVMRRTCGAMQVYQQMLEAEPIFRGAQVALEHAAQNRLRSAPTARTAPYQVTVVVHLVQSTGAKKVTDAQVASQVAVLNKDYRAKNTDRAKAPAPWKGLVADAQVEFQLATKDPEGETTTG